jgi:hypothetical protein
MGTGVNAQIISTSTFWRFELWTSLLLTALIIPLSYTLTVRYGIIGPAIANLVSFTVYNGIRCWFLWHRFQMHPFSFKTLEVLALALLSYWASHYLFIHSEGLGGMIGRSMVFICLYGGGVYFRKVTPDLEPIVQNLRKRLPFLRKDN